MKFTVIEFKNSFEKEEIDGVVLALTEMEARDFNTKRKIPEKEIRAQLEGDMKSVEILLKGKKHDNLLLNLEQIGVPYIIKSIVDDRPISGIVYNGVAKEKLIYDEKGNILGRMDGIVEAISLLEEDEEIRALILLNQFCIRTDLENMPRMAFALKE